MKILYAFLIALFCLTSIVQAEITKPQIDKVGEELACLCGTCPRRPLDECTCGYAQQQRERIKSMLAAGQTQQAIIDAFINDFGKEVLSTPPAEGFNLAAWIMPPVVLLFGFFVVKSVLRSWSQAEPAPVRQTTNDKSGDPYLDRLENDLKERDT